MLFLALWAGPTIGAIVGFLVGEFVSGELSADAPLILPLALFMLLGAAGGGILFVWFGERFRRRRN